ncbi:hypothetical protein [Phenylobacterium sp.]|uniref:hypothetical protein n=1 Tax=Phenylobacterium sp. TaxID=1871053 RepID=UPI00300396F2
MQATKEIATLVLGVCAMGWIPLSIVLGLAVISQIAPGQHGRMTIFVFRMPQGVLTPLGRGFLTAHQLVIVVGLLSWALLPFLLG